jgi:class 3 adenylate cyclase/predicted ATPase
MRCTSCGFANPDGVKFCHDCGSAFKNRCPNCGIENPLPAKFCGDCGTSLTGQPASTPPSTSPLQVMAPSRAEAERRQLTVMFCDLVGSTALSTQLDPEELREVIQTYQQTCVAVISQFEGYVGQYLGDGLLVYFGYPAAHEDDAARAIRAGLGIVTAIEGLSLPPHLSLSQPLQVRVGIHTGLVVVGEMGSGEYRAAHTIVGETPNIAARLQDKALPDSVVISPTTARLVEGLFETHELGPQMLKGITLPLMVSQVIRESKVQSRFEAAATRGLTPLIGREYEVGVLAEQWVHAKQRAGQVVLLSGEPGIGKSRLVQILKEDIIQDGATAIEFRCSPYYQNTAWYPIIEHVRRLLQFQHDESPEEKLRKLEAALKVGAGQAAPSQPDILPFFASLLSLPHPEGYPPLTLSPQKQKQRTQAAVVAWLIGETGREAVVNIWEDVHWADPSTLELLQLYLDRVPTSRMLAVLTFRPEFQPPWSLRSHMSRLTLGRLDHTQAEEMVERVASGKTLPTEIVQQIVTKTDGIPLFVEELTKSVVQSVGAPGRVPLQAFAIPITLQDSLMARLDRLGNAKAVAQVGATLGREFSYELLQAVWPHEKEELEQDLHRLVAAELVYQHGLPPHAQYIFKHALIQDAAYQSLLKRTRLQYHSQIAQVLEAKFPEVKEAQPELLAHHYTEAGLIEPAISYWQQAGQRAAERSANIEAISHFRKGITLLQTLPMSAERLQQELTLQMPLGVALMATKGYAALEVAEVQIRVQALCQQMGESPQLFQALPQLRGFYFVRGELSTARTLAEHYLEFARRYQLPILLVWASYGLGETLLFSGELTSARAHLEQGVTAYDPQQVRAFFVRTVQDPGVACLSQTATALWYLGYPDQALARIRQALALAQDLSHPFSAAWALSNVASHHQLRREVQQTQEWVAAAIQLAQEQEFPFWIARAETFRGWALAQQGRGAEGTIQIHHGMAAYRAMGIELYRPQALVLLAETYGHVRREAEGLTVLAEALEMIDKTGARLFEAEVHRLKGTLTLQSQLLNPASQVEKEAEACFLKAIEVAQKQQAKTLELRATTSLTRLWQQQGKGQEARKMLSEVYNWFTEGFDTKDLQEAKALLEELAEAV